MNFKLRQGLVLATLLYLITGCTTLSTPTFSDEDGAIRGYDSVAYHTNQRPVKGKPSLSTRWNDANWYFSSAENLAAFEADPERYAPQYGGYCAYAMSKGLVVSTDPNAWQIEDGKLYLNYSLRVRRTWRKDIPGYVAKADAFWQEKIFEPRIE